MNDLIYQIIIPVVTALLGVWSGKYLTKREKKKNDLQLVENSTTGLLNSIKIMSDTIDEMTTKYRNEQQQNIKLLQEVKELRLRETDLKTEIEMLRNQMSRLEAQQKELLAKLQEVNS